MTKITSSTILSLFIASLLALAAPAVKAQTTSSAIPETTPAPPATQPSEKKSSKNVDCFDYPLNIVTLNIVKLKDQTHEMFWKQDDCIRVLVTNNPFLFKYTLQFDEQTIKEDDILGGLKSLGVNSSPASSTPSQHKDQAKPSPSPNAQPLPDAKKQQALADFEKNKSEFQKQIFNDKALDSSQKNFVAEQVVKAIDQSASQLTAPQPSQPAYQEQDKVSRWQGSVDKLDQDAGKIESDLKAKTDAYAKFSRELPELWLKLLDHDASSLAIRALAIDVRTKASDLLAKLSDGEAEPQAGSSAFEHEALNFAREAARVHAQLADSLPPEGDHSASAESVRKIMEKLDRAGETVVFSACTYKAKRDNDFSSIRTGVIEPLDKILRDPLAFGYSNEFLAKRREGPFGDPTAVNLTVTRDSVAPFSTGTADKNTPANTTTPVLCSSDPTEMFENGEHYKYFDDFFTNKKQPGTTDAYTLNQNGPKPAGQTTPTAAPKDSKPAASDTESKLVLQQPWFFGKARLVLSGGLSTGFLGKKEFQRSTSISGTGSSATSSTVIGVKTDTRYRLTPMLYGHTLLYSSRHDHDAWYATLGVTANSDNKGTSPEFLLGGSRSFAQQKFFVTLGAYIGEQQKLDGGLQVGQTIPSTLSGELPVTKSYHASWGFGISYRFASTKDPQKDSSTPAKPSSGGAKKTGN
jgi:hypothetical protein